MERLLITINDIRKYHDLDPNYDEERFNGFLRVIQQRNLKSLLGDALYLDLMTNHTQVIYTNLINGEQYTYGNETIEYFGLKPVLCHWWLGDVTRKGEAFLTNYGSVEFVNNFQQQFQGARLKEAIASEFMRTASDYANDVIQYLDEKSSSYPLWDSKPKEPGTQFTILKIS